jgi:hypothetical protein
MKKYFSTAQLIVSLFVTLIFISTFIADAQLVPTPYFTNVTADVGLTGVSGFRVKREGSALDRGQLFHVDGGKGEWITVIRVL